MPHLHYSSLLKPPPRTSPPHFSITEEIEVKHDKEAFIYFCWPERGKAIEYWMRPENKEAKWASWLLLCDVSDMLLSPVWYKTEMPHCSLSMPQFFIAPNITLYLSSSLSPLKSLLPVRLSL